MPLLSLVFLVILGLLPTLTASDAVVSARKGAVVAAHPLASQAGLEILQAGGNAVDAAVATAFALAVVHPTAGNLGGGGFLIAYLPGKGELCIDFRERAPGGASRDMYLDSKGKPIKDASTLGPLAAGVPGSPAGLLLALERFGTLPRSVVMARAIEWAEKGFPMDPNLARSIMAKKKDLLLFPASKAVFFPGGKDPLPGTLFKQVHLAQSLKRIRDLGRKGFYQGETARLIVKACSDGKGLITLKDLLEYRPVIRKPLAMDWRGYRVLSMPPPSSGGVCLFQMLAFVDPFFPKKKRTPLLPSAEEVHVMTQAMRLGFADRAAWLGDPDFFPVPLKGLLAPAYLKRRSAHIVKGPLKGDVEPGKPKGAPKLRSLPKAGPKEGGETTHFSVVDPMGGAVTLTTTLNSSYGAKVVVAGAGFLLNNEMDDFSLKPGVPNQFGLVGGEANAIVPGKRMLSSMTPTLVLKDDKVELVLGSPGGPRIITTVFQVMMNRLVFSMDLRRAVTWPRFHQQWRPELLRHEKFCFSPEVLTRLGALGWSFKVMDPIGRCQAISRSKKGGWTAVTDLRGSGGARGF